MSSRKSAVVYDRIGSLVGLFHKLLAEAENGQCVDSLKLQKLFNEISERSHAPKRETTKRAKARRDDRSAKM